MKEEGGGRREEEEEFFFSDEPSKLQASRPDLKPAVAEQPGGLCLFSFGVCAL